MSGLKNEIFIKLFVNCNFRLIGVCKKINIISEWEWENYIGLRYSK